ncbi:DUF1285 domain-containing protein [Colwellia sp. RSH04]|uniref:DUF1285 domain-containing protein n=1 Tax=Colwellia sp. RSH04 TaxID=2305464 RepID=UPI000E595549|nr:DUF1285 domain-containing protein [Colwellia sp. RSH04]RHW76946.1 DUF1285 domain-containing protein [Colwellia sp. RSH04]
MSLEKFSAELNKYQQSLPPVESWNPSHCGDIDIEIKRNGDWFHEGSAFKRMPLVKLLSSVLIREQTSDNDDYFLITPVEKMRIRVEDAPFVLTHWQWQENEQAMLVETNVGDSFILNGEHPIECGEDGSLYVIVRRNLKAKVHRNVYYQWVDLATEEKTSQGTELVFTSAKCQFSLGKIS